MRNLLIGAGLALLLSPFAVHAESTVSPVGCKPSPTAPAPQTNSTAPASSVAKTLLDVSLQGAVNSYGPINQDIGVGNFSLGICDGQHDGRWHLEGSFAGVNQSGRGSYAALLGGGYQFSLGGYGSLTPLVRVGYEHFQSFTNHAVVGAAVSYANSWRLMPANAPDDTRVEFAVVPEYTRRQTLGGFSSVISPTTVNFTSTEVIGLNFPIKDVGLNFPGHSYWRGKVSLVDLYIDGGAPTNHIVSVVLGAVKMHSPGDRCTHYCWAGEVWYSRGDGRYESVLIGVTRRFGL